MRTSTIVVSHDSAIRCIRYERSHRDGLSWLAIGRVEERRILERCQPTTDDIDEAILARMGLFDEADGNKPLDVLSSASTRYRSTSQLTHHYSCGLLPTGSILQAVRPDVYVTSPALSVIHFAYQHALPETIGLIYELCGTFSLSNPVAAPESMRSGYQECEPALTVAALARYLKACSGLHGLKRAQTATAYALDGARSPAEAIMDAMFHTAKRQGGFGCTPMLLNYRIEFTENARDIASGMPYAIADAYLPEAQSILEYNGWYHDHPLSRLHDDRRLNALREMGYHVFVINQETLRDLDALEAIARNIYHHAGKQYRCATQGHRVKQVALLNGLRAWSGLEAC